MMFRELNKPHVDSCIVVGESCQVNGESKVTKGAHAVFFISLLKSMMRFQFLSNGKLALAITSILNYASIAL